MSDINALETKLLSDIAAAQDEGALEGMRITALGRKGSVSELLKTLGTMTPEERRREGPRINGLKDRVNAAIAERREKLKAAALGARLNTEALDVTLPVRESPPESGRVHPISQVIDELTVIFADMGFAVAEGPDIETDDNNFTMLNTPAGHPAREMHDTFFFPPKPDGSRLLLRSHTSTVVLPGSSAGLTKVTSPLMGSSRPEIFSRAGFPTLRMAASDCAMCALAISLEVFITVRMG